MTRLRPIGRGAARAVRTVSRRLLREDRGVSAMEFALFAPVLFFAAVATLDLGIALYERMSMDRLLRGGAQAAMGDPGASTVRAVIEASAEDDFAPGAEFALTVERYCACPVDTSATAVCTNVCGDGSVPGIFYRLEADREYPGLVLPSIDLAAEARVRVR